jgi:hypothetical protein
VANPSSAEIVLTILHPGNSNHNGGQLAFGPRDGYLYLGPGDGGGGGDPGENAQDPAELLGKILRIDVETGDPSTYTIPPSNPYATTPGYRPEIWDLGVRNPFRFSFDRATGDLFIADVGQNNVEEIDHEPAGDPGGRNYGWDCYEGSTPYETAGCGPAANYVFPVWQYTHALGCSVTGGYVYRGQLFPVMSGIYFYGDFCSGRIWGLSFDGTSWQNTEYLDSAVRLSSFGEDVNGEVYVVDLNGAVYRLEGDSTTQTRTFYSKGAYDGWVLESSETSGTGGNINVTATTIRLGDNALNRQYRSILDFATGSLPDNAQIVSATLCIKRYSLIGTSPFATHKGLLVDIRKWAYSGSRDLQSTDFQAAAQLNEAATIPNAPSNGWYCGSLSDPALSYIHLIGRTQVRLRFELDDNNDNGADYLNFYSGNTSANPAYRPRLTVEYSVP